MKTILEIKLVRKINTHIKNKQFLVVQHMYKFSLFLIKCTCE